MTESKDKDITAEQAQEVIDKRDEALNPKGLREETNQASGIVMKANKVDPSVLTYDPSDVQYDEEARKAAEKARKEDEKK